MKQFLLLFMVYMCYSCNDRNFENEKDTQDSVQVYSTLVSNIQEELLCNYIITKIDLNVEQYLTKIHNGQFIDIDYLDASVVVWEPAIHLERLREMCVAWANPQSIYYHNNKLTSAIESLFEYWENARLSNPNSWWWNSIGVSKRLGESLILFRYNSFVTNKLYSNLIKLLDRLNPRDYNGGANLTDVATYHFYKGVLLENDSIVEECANLIFSSASLNRSEEGLQVDGSALSDGVRYISGYGEDLLLNVLLMASFVKNTPFLKQDILDLLSNYVLGTYQNVLRGPYMDFLAGGRGGVARQGFLKNSNSPKIISLMKKIDVVNSKKYELILNRINQDVTSSAGVISSTKIYYCSDYALHNSEKFNIGIGGTSTRIKKPEKGNGENLLGTLLSCGATSIRVNGDEYYNIFPCWDWTLIPGVTSSTILPSFGRDWGEFGTTRFCGGCSDNSGGVFSLDYDDYGISIRKSYFMIPDGVICVGSNLSYMISGCRTCVNQCIGVGNVDYKLLKTSDIFSLSKIDMIDGQFEYVHHNKIYYIPLDDNEYKISKMKRMGSWNLINSESSLEPVENDIFLMWVDHNKSNSYAYAILPSLNSYEDRDLEKYQIFRQEKLHALYNTQLGILYIVFFESGTFLYANKKIEVSEPCSMVINWKNNIGYISDPSQVLNSIQIGIDGCIKRVNFPIDNNRGKQVDFHF